MNQKLISFTVSCYNSAEYMRKCIESILPGGDEVEILIVDDGSTDETGAIADEYEKNYPGICRAIHQENGGHGEAVNTGLRNATGEYFKVVDSDDWIDREAYDKVRATLRDLLDKGTPVDMLLTNYVYEKPSENHERRMLYHTMFDDGKIVGWSDMKHLIPGFTILMHSVTYRTKMVRESGLHLPDHTFYVDNLYVYVPLPYVKTIYYLDVDYYRYYIGREGQSVAEQTMIKRIDQQLRVNYMLFDAYDPWSIENDKLRDYMLGFLQMITVVSTSLAYLSGSDENLEKIKKLYEYVKGKDIRTYKKIRHGVLGKAMNLPGKFGRYLSLKGYHAAQKFMGFN